MVGIYHGKYHMIYIMLYIMVYISMLYIMVYITWYDIYHCIYHVIYPLKLLYRTVSALWLLLHTTTNQWRSLTSIKTWIFQGTDSCGMQNPNSSLTSQLLQQAIFTTKAVTYNCLWSFSAPLNQSTLRPIHKCSEMVCPCSLTVPAAPTFQASICARLAMC